MAVKKTKEKPLHSKKEIKKELAGKIEFALPEIRTKLGEKKFNKRIKKATKILVQGLHSKDFSDTNSTNGSTAETASRKIKDRKKVTKKTKAAEPDLPSA